MLAFVTVGSTKFDALIATAFTPQVLNSFRRKGYTEIVVQCGKSVFELSDVISEGGVLNLSREGVDMEVYKYKPSLEEDYRRADLVVSHAGSGTILEVLRMGKPMIVAPNTTLLDNHQAELASALDSMGYLKSTAAENLADAIDHFEPSEMKPFPPHDPSRFARIVDEVMGFI